MSSNINANGIQVGSNYRTGAIKSVVFNFQPGSVTWSTAASVTGQRFCDIAVSALVPEATDIQAIISVNIIDFSAVSPNDFYIGGNGNKLHMTVKSSATWNPQGYLKLAINYTPTES